MYKKKCTIKAMGMKLIQKVKDSGNLKNYGIMKGLRGQGIEITTQGIDSYERPDARSMRLDVLCGLRKLAGVSWSQFGKWLDEEFNK